MTKLLKNFVTQQLLKATQRGMFLLPVILLYFCHIEAKNVHHFFASVYKAESYLPKLLRFMLLITSDLLRYLLYLRININSLIYGENVKNLTKAGYHFPDFHLMLSIPSLFCAFFLDKISWFLKLMQLLIYLITCTA